MAKKDISRAEYISRQERLQVRKEKFYTDNQAQREKQRAERDLKFRQERQSRAVIDGLSSVYGLTRIFAFVIGCLLLISLISSLTGTGVTRTFAGMLDFLSTAPEIPTDWLNWGTIEIGDWGILDFIANFFETLVTIVNAVVFFAVMIINALIFVLWFVGWLFVGA